MSLKTRLDEVIASMATDVKALYLRMVPAAGTSGQVLKKIDTTNFNANWLDPSSAASAITDPYWNDVTLLVTNLGNTIVDSSQSALTPLLHGAVITAPVSIGSKGIDISTNTAGGVSFAQSNGSDPGGPFDCSSGLFTLDVGFQVNDLRPRALISLAGVNMVNWPLVYIYLTAAGQVQLAASSGNSGHDIADYVNLGNYTAFKWCQLSIQRDATHWSVYKDNTRVFHVEGPAPVNRSRGITIGTYLTNDAFDTGGVSFYGLISRVRFTKGIARNSAATIINDVPPITVDEDPIFTFDPVTGNLTNILFTNGSQKAFTYDVDNRLTQVVNTKATGTITKTFTYNPNGSLASIVEA